MAKTKPPLIHPPIPGKKRPLSPDYRERPAKWIRKRRAKLLKSSHGVHKSIKEFVEDSRKFDGHDCLFVPGAQKGVPAKITRFGKQMSAARYMCLLTHGTPPTEGMVVRHLCGCGHLSCVNPRHLVWGTQGDNIADANKHRSAGDNIQDRINAID